MYYLLIACTPFTRQITVYYTYIVVSVVPQDGQTALIYAVEEHCTEIVKMLLAAGADVNLQEKVNLST